jgi:hypothetical protein
LFENKEWEAEQTRHAKIEYGLIGSLIPVPHTRKGSDQQPGCQRKCDQDQLTNLPQITRGASPQPGHLSARGHRSVS